MSASILRGGGIAAVLVAALVSRARAGGREIDEPRFHLVYAAPAGCPDRAVFLSAILARTKRSRLASEGEAATELAVAIEATPARTNGRLEVREVDDTRQLRSVSSDSCTDVAQALALIAALILDPDARIGEEPSSPPVSPPEDHAPAPPAAPDKRGRPGWTETTVPRTTASGPGASPKLDLSAGAQLGAMGGVAPVLAPSAGGFVDLDAVPGGSGLAPSVRLGLDFATASSSAPAGRQSYWWLGGTLRGCPVRAVLAHRLSVAPCAAFAFGAHHATTSGVRNPTSSITPWLAAVVGASLEWTLAPAFTLELQGGAAFPILRRRFFLADPETTIFEVPSASGVGSVAGRWRFW